MFGFKIKVRLPKIRITKPSFSIRRYKSLEGRTGGVEDILALTGNDNLTDLGIEALKIADKRFTSAINDEEKASNQIEAGEVSIFLARLEQTIAKIQLDAIANVVKAKK